MSCASCDLFLFNQNTTGMEDALDRFTANFTQS